MLCEFIAPRARRPLCWRCARLDIRDTWVAKRAQVSYTETKPRSRLRLRAECVPFHRLIAGGWRMLARGSRNGRAMKDAALVYTSFSRRWSLPPDTQEKGTAEIIIGKQRNGPIGTVRLTFLGEHTRFENFATLGSY